ncbi:M20/M25/M40 family metallo-hydrolase [Clostridium sp.]|uniref:M20/M25/M40 family metallo-hydrolase n=1 Tax=Clostridium sp. TaxID=1506 RepID=UPI003F3A993A
MKVIKKILSAAIALSLVISSVSYAEKVNATEQYIEQKKSISEKLNVNEVMSNISYFSEGIGERFAGSEKEKESADYIYNYFKGLGYDVEVQEVPIVNKRGTVKVASSEDYNIMGYRTVGTFGEGFVEGKAVNCETGSIDQTKDEVSDNIAIIKNSSSVVDAIKNSVNKGAKAIAIYNDKDGSFRVSLGSYKCPVPVVLIPKVDGEALVSDLETSGEDIICSVGETIYDKTWNVIATKKATGIENPEVLHVTAHYDSVAGSPGANDNASGAAMLMELAKLFVDYDTKADIKFVAFGAEEIGLKGSKYYVDNLTSEEKEKTIGNMNMDMIGTNYEECTQLAIETVDGSTHKVTDAVLNAGRNLGKDHYFVSKYGGSDHVSFHNAGIDEVTFIWVIPNTNDNGTEPWYHTYEDTIDKISPERLGEMGELISSTIFDLVGATDKVEEEIVVSKVENIKLEEVTNNSAKITWEKPNSPNGLVSYIIYKDGKVLEEISSDKAEIIISNLTANTIYGVKIVSKYSNGELSKPVSVNLRTIK